MTPKIKVNCRKTNLKKIRSFLKDCLKQEPLSDNDAHLLLVAVDEVCANLMIHGHDCNPKSFLEIYCYREGHNLIFDVLDQGPFFNINAYKEPSIERLLQERRNGGMGLILVKNIMDGITTLQQDGHNVYRMWKVVG